MNRDIAPQATLERNEARFVTLTSPGHSATQTVFGPPAVEEGKLTALFGSPRGIMILVPLLVLGLGAALTIIGQLALGAVSRTMAHDRFVADTSAVALGLENTLGQAEPLLDELERIGRAAQPTEAFLPGKKQKAPEAYDHDQIGPVALELRDLLVGRPGITQAYIAYPNGVFISADPAGPRSIGIQVTQDGRSTSYQVKGQKVHRISQRKSKYDPRTRDWYQLAERRKERSWSAPYTFFFNQHTGVTRSLPLYKDDAKTELLGVVGVDFDVDALTAFMAASESVADDVHAVVFTLGGVVLAYPKEAGKLARIQNMKRVPTHEALKDPQLSALIAKVQSAKNHRTGLLRFDSARSPMLAAIRRVGAGGPDWYVATFSPESAVLRELYDHRRSSLLVGTLSLLFAVSLAWFLARRVLFVRRVAYAAQAAAQQAQDQVRDLGSYRLVSRIGEGGMGEVWRASHRLLARQAAIKLIKSGPTAPERKNEQRERFRREAQAIAGLRSHNTIALYDYGVTSDDTLFYVMELLDGIDLNFLVNEHGAQAPERVRRILIQTCNSLAEAHNAQLVHRDIKPANLFLCREADDVDIVKVLDFGLVFRADTLEEDARPVSSRDTQTPRKEPVSANEKTDTQPSADNEERITRADHQLGTPAFMSPEQALGSATDGRSDIYSLACVAWWLLTAQPPFKADSAMALMLKHIEEAPGDLRASAPDGVSQEFSSLLLSCLAKSPLDRPQSAQELADQLKALGVQGPGWSEDQARAWWKANVPLHEDWADKPTLPPLRGAEVIPPKEAV